MKFLKHQGPNWKHNKRSGAREIWMECLEVKIKREPSLFDCIYDTKVWNRRSVGVIQHQKRRKGQIFSLQFMVCVPQRNKDNQYLISMPTIFPFSLLTNTKNITIQTKQTINNSTAPYVHHVHHLHHAHHLHHLHFPDEHKQFRINPFRYISFDSTN